MAGHPAGGWQRGSAIWGMHGTDVGGVGVHWARPPGHCAICAPVILLAMPINLTDLPTPGRLGGAGGNPLDAGASGGGSLQSEKSIGGRPGGSGTYPDIPAVVVLGAVMPPEDLLPGSMMEGAPESRLPCRCTWSLGDSSNGNILILLPFPTAGVGPQLGGPYRCPG